MMFPIPHDYHTHSTFSSDGHSSLEEMCQRAIQLGLPEIGFSEHLDFHPSDPSVGFYQPEAFWKEFERLQPLFDGQLILRAGLEIGEPHRYQEQYQPLLDRFPYDYIIGSLHNIADYSLWDEKIVHQRSADDSLNIYFEELEQMTRQPAYDILGHLDIPVRIDKQFWGGYDPGRYESLIRRVLQNTIDHGTSLDVNVSGLRKPTQNIMPDPLILRWYHEMGGELVTLGSDAHSAAEVGQDFDQALAAIRQAGLKSVTQFVRRQAHPLALPLQGRK